MKNSFFIISVLISCILMADPIDLSKAQRVAGNIYAERSNTGSMAGGVKMISCPACMSKNCI